MKKTIERAKPLIRLQSFAWYFFFSYFGLATALHFYKPEFASDMVYVGVILLLVVTLIKALVIGNIFQKENKKTFAYLCYLLTVVLLIITLMKLWI